MFLSSGSAFNSSRYLSSCISAMISSREVRRVAALSSENTRGLLNLSTLSCGPSDWSKMCLYNNTVTSLTYPPFSSQKSNLLRLPSSRLRGCGALRLCEAPEWLYP